MVEARPVHGYLGYFKSNRKEEREPDLLDQAGADTRPDIRQPLRKFASVKPRRRRALSSCLSAPRFRPTEPWYLLEDVDVDTIQPIPNRYHEVDWLSISSAYSNPSVSNSSLSDCTHSQSHKTGFADKKPYEPFDEDWHFVLQLEVN